MVVGWVVHSVFAMCVLASCVCKDFVHVSVNTHTHTLWCAFSTFYWNKEVGEEMFLEQLKSSGSILGAEVLKAVDLEMQLVSHPRDLGAQQHKPI